MGDEEISLVRKKLKWNSSPFEIPQEILDEWREIGNKGEQTESNWLQMINKNQNLKMNLTNIKKIRFIRFRKFNPKEREIF